MKCSEAQRLISPYLEQKLPDETLSPFLKHIRTCASCREDLEIYLAVYEALDNDEENDYDFVNALDRRLDVSEDELKQRRRWSIAQGVIVLLAELVLVFALIAGVRSHLETRRLMNAHNFAESPAEQESESVSEEPSSELYTDDAAEGWTEAEVQAQEWIVQADQGTLQEMEPRG